MKHKLTSTYYHENERESDSFVNRLFDDGKKCVICHEKITKKNVKHFIFCKNFKCNMSYCIPCWNDAGNQCLRCAFIKGIKI